MTVSIFRRRHRRTRPQPPHNSGRPTTRRPRTGLSTTSQLKILLNCIALVLCNNYFFTTTAAAGASADSLEHCFHQRQMGTIGTCLGQRALSYLQNIEESPNVTLFDGSLKIVRNENDVHLGTQSRSLVNFLDLNPTDFT